MSNGNLLYFPKSMARPPGSLFHLMQRWMDCPECERQEELELLQMWDQLGGQDRKRAMDYFRLLLSSAKAERR